MYFGGFFIAFIGYMAWGGSSFKKSCSTITMALGILWSVSSAFAIVKRKYRAIEITESHIKVPINVIYDDYQNSLVIPKKEIIDIYKSETLKGRDIHISLIDGSIIILKILQYCELNYFLKQCVEYKIKKKTNSTLEEHNE